MNRGKENIISIFKSHFVVAFESVLTDSLMIDLSELFYVHKIVYHTLSGSKEAQY
jgi:hypothetical protein